MKVILSRKGFDSSAGGYPSPYFVDSGRLMSFPIPDDEDKNTELSYSDLFVDQHTTYLDMMRSLGIKKINESTFVHLDPDINATLIPNRDVQWRGIFGQSSSAQSHLSNKIIEKGDLFLFFGWFKDVEKTKNGYRYISGTDKHIIWGYLQVGEIESIDKNGQYDSWKQKHPHYHCRNRARNTAYIASSYLTFDNSLPGYGVFKYSDLLVLTEPKQRNRSLWRLPSFFHPNFNTKVSYHEKLVSESGKKIWDLKEGYCTLHSVGRGQEFVIEGNGEIEEWVKGLYSIGEETNMERFKDNEDGYIRWHDNNPNGFVLNHFGSNNDSYNVIHKSSCHFLWRGKDDGARTTYEKICSSNLKVLEQEVNRLRGSSWKYCSVCFGLL